MKQVQSIINWRKYTVVGIALLNEVLAGWALIFVKDLVMPPLHPAMDEKKTSWDPNAAVAEPTGRSECVALLKYSEIYRIGTAASLTKAIWLISN